ncbi:unnamed protein product [Gadus morhua 'NCC']
MAGGLGSDTWGRQNRMTSPPPAAPSCTLPGSSWQISTLASSASFRGPAQPRLITSIISPGQLKDGVQAAGLHHGSLQSSAYSRVMTRLRGLLDNKLVCVANVVQSANSVPRPQPKTIPLKHTVEAVIEARWWRLSGGGSVVGALWWRLCGGGSVVEALWWRLCGGGSVVEALWWRLCGGGSVVEALWWRLCGGGSMVEALWWRLYGGGSAASPGRLSASDLMLGNTAKQIRNRAKQVRNRARQVRTRARQVRNRAKQVRNRAEAG